MAGFCIASFMKLQSGNNKSYSLQGKASLIETYKPFKNGDTYPKHCISFIVSLLLLELFLLSSV